MLLTRVCGDEEWVMKIEPLMPQAVADHAGEDDGTLARRPGFGRRRAGAPGGGDVRYPIDVAEELTRLAAHLSEVRRVLATGGACGKRLDFLMQELNREANTLGSKSVSGEYAMPRWK